MAPVSSNNSNTMTLEKKRSLPPDESTEEVRIVPIAEYEHAAMSLAEAFAVDEVARYFIDTDDMAKYTEEYKYKLHCDIMRYVTAAHCYKGIVMTIGPNYDAVALWMPPGKNMDDLWTIFRSGMWRLWYKLSSEGKTRFYNEFLPLLHETKHEVLGSRDDDSYYLVYLGSKPSARGKGYAKKLISHMTERADLEGRPVYLESSAESNIGYYKRHCFEEKKVIALKRGGKRVQMHIMVREPQAVVESSKMMESVEIRGL